MHANHGKLEYLPPKLLPALGQLLDALDYAEHTESDLWDFSIEIQQLREAGLNHADLRFLVRRGFVRHAREVTLVRDDRRQYRPTGDMTFTDRECFVLEPSCAEQIRSVCERKPIVDKGVAAVNSPVQSNDRSYLDRYSEPIPKWDHVNRELRVDGRLVKQFKWQAINQETVLAAFEEEGWPVMIDDPLPPKPNQDPKRRLHDTIKCLNKRQTHQLVRFHGNGNGEGVKWELLRTSNK